LIQRGPSKGESGKRNVAGRLGRYPDIRGDRRGDAELPGEEVSPKITVTGRGSAWSPMCQARWARGTDLNRVWPAGRPPPDRDAEGNPQAGLLPAGGFGRAWFRDKGDIPRLGSGFGLSPSTAYRYLGEVIEVLADAQSLSLGREPGHDRCDGVDVAAEVPIRDSKFVLPPPKVVYALAYIPAQLRQL
jgi:hypothetical protein